MKSGNGKRNLLLAAMMVSLATTMSAAYADTTVSPTISSIKQASIAYINDTSRTPISLYADKGDNTNSVYVNGSTYYFTPDESVKVVVTNLVNTGSSSLYQQETPSYPVFTIPGDQPLYYSYNPITLPESSYSISEGTSQNYNFTTTDGTTTSYYKTNLSTINLLNNINGSTVWDYGQGSNNFSVVLPNNETRYFNYGYNKPDGWGDGERQTYGQNGNAAGNSADYNNRTFNGIDSTTSGGAIYIDGKYPAGEGHGSNRIGTMTADFINNSITNTTTSEKGLGGALHIWGPYAGIETLNSNFIGNYIKYGTAKSGGGALAIGEGYDGGELTVGLINGNFINNYIEADSYNLGGAIYYEGSRFGDGEITSIGQAMQTTKFVGNHISGSGSGGAIYAVNKIGSIYADFIGNYIEGSYDASKGGAIFLIKTADEKTVGSITGDFIGNYITTSINNGTAYGGAIYNSNIVGSITGDFVGNYVVSTQNDTYGGAIYNTGTITTLTSNFIGNYANGGNVRGGAIDNYDGGTITTLNGKFIENIVYSNAQVGSNAVGGAIANRSNSVIQNISGDFIRNKARTSYTSSSRTVSGGAIYNDGSKIGTINANFIENEAHREAGAIYNNGDSSYDKGIETISGNFIKNKVTGEISSNAKVRGGAISNTGTIDSITNATFTNNTVNSASGYQSSYGGAIYNDGSITSIAADFINNKAEQTGNNNYEYNIAGGAIQNYDGSIGTITGNFEGNSALNDKTLQGLGGAISNYYASGSTQITNLNADFTSNTAYKGGAISNYSDSWYQSPEITSISGKVAETKAQFNSNTAYKDGGAIYNYSGTIGSLNADFTGNKVEGKAADVVYANGGAISNIAYKNTASISNLTGKFDGNYVSSVSGSNTEYGYDAYASGGAIFNKGNASPNKNANLTGISGSFENNYAYAKTNSTSAKQATAKGGAIYNGGYGVIDALTVNFIGNYAKAETPTSATTNAEGGAIYNDQNGTIGYISGATFGGDAESKGNYATSNSISGGHAYGGAIYNKGTIGDIEHDIYSISDSLFKNNYVSSPSVAQGGAIYSTTDLYISNTDFVNNTAQVEYDQGSKGGAIYQYTGNLLLVDSSFTGNKADKGAAIYGFGANVTAYAKTDDVEFANNNITGLADGEGYGLYIDGGSLNLKADTGHTLTINDNISSSNGMTINADSNAGTVALNGVLSVAGGGKVTLNSGTLALGQNALSSFGIETNELKFVANGGTLDIANTNIDNVSFSNAVDIKGAMNLGLDVNLTGTTATADKITAEITSGNTSAITISAINFINDNYTGSEEEHNLTVADGTIKSLINETVNPTVTGNTNTYSYSYDQDTGILTVSLVTYDNIYDAVHDTEKATRTYKIKLAEGETITQALGALSGTKLTVNGNNKYLDGDSKGGITVANGQTLELKNISQVKNFTTAVDNAGTLNVEGVTFTSNTTDVNNTATLNLSGSNTINTITGATGTTNINSGATTFTNSIAQNEIAMKGGRIVVNSGATITGDVKGYEDISYISENGTRAIYNNGGIISKITGTYKGNSAAQSTTSNVKGGVLYTQNGTVAIDSATFDGNSVEGSSGGSGGAIYSNGTALTITGTAENPTVFKNNGISKYDNNYQGSAYGGVIYQTGGTLNISNAKFENNVSDFNIKSNLYGGAIYSEATGGNISADFTGNTLSAVAGSAQGGAIYNRGTITKITGDFVNNAITLQPTSSSEQYGESSGGAIANGGTITNGIDGTFSGNTITTNVKQSDANGGAIANGGTIGNITGDFLNNSVASTNTTYSGSARGGAIYNLNGTIGNIIATSAEENGFKGNSATKAAGYNAEGLGGAIYNHAEGYNATIGNITADFINNTATTNGGAIYNYAADNNKAEIGNIIGNFTGNTAYQGSAIYNYVNNNESYIDNKLAIIGDITGNFSENNGTVIYNKGYYDYNNFNEIVYAQIGDITGDFTENNASSGNIIYNDYAQIGDIIGDFTENTTNNGVINNSGSIDSITANTTTQKGFYKNTGSAIRNYASADYHREATIGNITADFKENNAGAYSGAAINNSSANANLKAKIGNITGNFDQNASTNYGGAISNTYAIIGTQNNLGEFTGTAITGNFTNNQVTNNSVANPSGGAITNENSSSIGNIQGNFENNSIINSNYKAMGGAIANRTSSTIGNITGNFNANSISYNPIFDTDTFEAQHYGNSSLGGAIYNDSTSTIGTLTGDFVGNWAKGHVAEDDTTTVFAAAGGAIYNEGTLGTITGDIKNNYALGHSHHGVYGGAIYTTTGLNLVDSDITGNYVTTQSASATDLKGGAIYTTDGINITASTKNISVSGNKGTEQGAAIYNTSENNAVVLNATGGNITFENNNLTGLSNGSGVGIYSTGGLTVNSASNKYVSLNDALNIVGNTTLNGTLKLGDNAVETLANTTSKFIAQGGALDIANGAIDTMTFANAVDIQNAINLGLDVNLTGTTATADKITADFTTGNTSAITLSALNFINDNYTGSEEEHELTIASGTIKSLINGNITSTTGNTNTYTYSYDQNTGILTVSLVTYDNIYDAVHDTEKATRTYKIKLAEGETITQALGALAGTKLTVNGNNKYLDGDSKGGITVANGQTLELKNISQVKNFTTAVDNAGTLNVDNVTFTNNSTADINNTGMANILNSDVSKIINSSTVNVTDSTIRNIKNTGVLNISDTDGTPVYMLLITDSETPEGITNITGGYTQFVGNVTQNTINLKGGNLTLENNATVNANIVADGTVDKTGYLNINSNGSTINGTISGTFKGNDDIGALSNAGTVGNVTANFVNNTHSGSSDIMGGAIYNTGTMGTISGNFTGNSATSSSGNAKGGAIYQQGGTLTISGATFGGSAAGQGNSATATASGKHGYGGAIYLDSGTMTVSDSAFEKNSATQGGAIYQNSGSLTITDSTFKNNTSNVGGAIYQKAGTLSIDGSTFDNSGNLWQEGGNLSITDSNFTNTDVTSRLGSNVTISGTTFDNSSVHFIGKGNETSAANQNTFSIVNSTIKNIPDNYYNAYALSVVGGDVTIDGVNIINNTYAKAIKSESAAQGPGDNTHYSKINIIAQAADVNITGNKYGINVIGWGNDPSLHTTLSLYAKDHDILISNNSEYGIYYSDDYGVLTLNADTDHNITINDAITSTTGMTVNAGGTHLGTVALNGSLANAGAISVGGGTLELGSTAVTSLATDIETNEGTVVLTGGTLYSAIAGATTITGTVIDNAATSLIPKTLDNITITNTGNLTKNGGTFTTADNAGTFNINGVILTADGTSIKNTNVLNLTGSNTIKTITDAVTPTGTTNITGGLTTIDYNGSVVQNAVNMRGGGLLIRNHATVNKVVGDENYTGSFIVVNGGAISSLEGTFKGSDTYRALDYNSDTALTIDGVTFDSNTAGAIYHSWSGLVDSSIDNAIFINNTAEEGGAYIQRSTNSSEHTVSFDNATFTSNSAENKGGAISARLNGRNKLNISDSTFTGNTVTAINGLGSAIYLEGIAGYDNTPSSYTIDNSTFTSNGAGGVVYANGGNLTVKNSTFTSNSGDAIVLADNYQYWTIIGGQIAQVYSPITANIVAETGNVAITDNSGWGIVGNKNHETDSALTLYAKSGNITINGNTAGGINNNGLVLTLNADTGHNITINDAVSSTTGMTVNAGGTHAGTVALNGALTLGDVISVGGGTLELGSTAVTSLNKAISTNSGTVKLTGGTLTQAIAGNTTVSGSDVTLGTNGSLVNATVANGAKLTSQASQFTTMNNLGTLLLSGTLDKAISGTGETKINQTLTFAEGENPAKASIAGTLNMNSGTLNMVEEETPAYTNYTVGTLKGSGNLAIDFDGTNTDKLTITTADETPITVTLTALNGFTKGQDAVSAKTILSGASNITLAISSALREAYDDTVITPNNYDIDPILSTASWTDEFKNRYYDISTGKQLTVDNSTDNKTLAYVYNVQNIYDPTKDVSQGDTLALVNQKVDTTRTFTTTSATATYNVTSALGTTAAGNMTVQGATTTVGDVTTTSTLNMAQNTGFVVGEDTTLTLNTVKVTGTKTETGSLINNTAGSATLNNVEVAQNSANVINNANTLNLEGANTINAGITGTNGTTNVNSGSSIVNSITQKLINIFTGAKLASNGNVTVGTGDGEGIQNAVANGLELKGGTLTGNVAGDGSTKIAGTVSVADGSKISQGINIASGKLKTSATGIDGAVSNAVENGLELTGGTLTKAVTGDGTTLINTANNVIIGDGGSIAQVIAVQSGTLKTGVNGFTQNITSNSGIVELTGTGTLTQTIAGNTTVSGTDIRNNGSLANVTIAGGGVLTSASDKISGTINNGGTLKLSGDLNRTISGSGETIANSDLTIGTNASVTGTLNANDKVLVMSGDSLATQTSVGTLKGSGTLSIDVINNSGTIVSDSIEATTYDNSVAFEVNNMTGFADAVNSLTLSTTTGQNVGFDLTVLDGYTGAGLTISDAYLTAYNNVAKAVDRSHTEELRSTVNWTEKFTEESWKDNYNQTLTKNNGVITYNIVKTGETAHQFADGDTLQMLNTTTDFGTDERKFVTNDKNATYDVTADSLGATAAGTMTVKGATDGTTTSTINMANNTGFVVGEGATVNLDTVNITGTKSADGSLINNTAGEVNLNNVSVATNANDVIANNSTMNLTGSNDINSGITGTGTTNVKSGTSIIDRIAQKVVEIFTGAKLETESIAATNGVTNAGDLEITGTSNTSNISGNGSTKFTNNVNNSGSISQNEVEIASGKTLTTTGDITTDTLTNGGTVTLNSADTSLTIKGGTAETPTTIGGTINGTGSTVIEGNAQNNGTIASAVEIATTGSLKTNANDVTGAIINNNALELIGGTIQSTIDGNGTTTISGVVSNSGNKSIDNKVTIASGSLTTDASQIKQAVTNNVNDGLNLTGGNLASNISGTGSTVISGNVTNNDGKSLGTDMTVSGSLTSNADNIGGDITNSGNVQLTGGTLAKDITGGTTQIAGNVTNSANIGGTTNITSGSLDNSNGKIANATVGAGTSLTSNADNVSGTVNVTGDYNVTGGAIAGAVTGTGNTNINADTEVKAAVSSNIIVSDGKTLDVNPTSGNISSAVSVALGDGSKLDISGNTAAADTLNNISVASGKTANLAMDWGDSISTNNIAGNLNVSDIDLTGTTIATPTTYNMATGSNIANVAINENVNLKTNETSFNQVKYNSTTGSFTGAKNNLVQAVTTTEAGESAIYSMSGDEPAGSLGAGVLDGGKLIVQGNGNTISGYGIEVGDGTHNAILTIKDANMKDITGDALLVKGGNTATVMAENSDIEISGATGNAITLNKDANGNSTVNINGGSHTVTIENDIISDDSGNTINFNSGTINFNGKFDPAAAVVGGATVNRGGDDDGIDWTVTSGTLNYLQDSYLNRATNTMNLNGGTLNTVNGVVTDFALGGFTLSNDSNFYADVDLAAGKMDNFISTPTTYTGGTLHVAGLNLISDATADNTSIPFANSTLAGHVDYTGAQGLTALSPIYKYNVGYNSSNGNFDFARYNSGGYDGLNPAIMAAPVAAQMGGYLTQLNSYDEAFRNMDMYMLMTASQRQALKNKNKIASLDGGVLYDQTLMRQERAEGWFRPFATFEKVGLRNGPKVENIAYGTYMGGESQMYDLGHGWDGMWGAYVGYNGSHQNYDGVSIYQNGGTLGVLGMAYKGNFFTGLTINAGASGVEASTMYGNENFAMLMTGIASKTGYNWELFNGKFIIQPSMLMSYSFVNTFDYKNAAGVNVDSDPLHAIQLQPELKFIGNLKNGWQPYASVAMVWNIMDNTKFKANDVSLPELSVKPYVKYGVGVRKTWGERLTGFFQTYLTNGGRNGVGLQAGFTWAFGGGKNKKADEQKIQKSLNKTPELKKTEIILNGHKVQ